MRILVLGIVLLAGSLLPLYAGLECDASFFVSLSALSALVIVEGILACSKGKRVEAKSEPTSNGATNAAKEIDELRRHAETVEGALERTKQSLAELAGKQREEQQALRTALEEAQARISAQQAQASLSEDAESGAVKLLSLLQEKGRLLDFLMDDIAPYSEQQVGAAARVVHQGCAGVIKQYFDITQVHSGKEGERVTLDKGYSPSQFRVIGRVVGEPPFKGVLLHRGWKTGKINLPRAVTPVTKDASTHGGIIIAPAEVELN
jgi:hypothetical protein